MHAYMCVYVCLCVHVCAHTCVCACVFAHLMIVAAITNSLMWVAGSNPKLPIFSHHWQLRTHACKTCILKGLKIEMYLMLCFI